MTCALVSQITRIKYEKAGNAEYTTLHLNTTQHMVRDCDSVTTIPTLPKLTFPKFISIHFSTC